MRRRDLITSVIAVGVGLWAASLSFAEPETLAPPLDATRLIGSALPTVYLRTLSGDSVSLESARAGRPTLLIVTKATDTASCARFAFEVRILRRKFPRVHVLLIGSGLEVSGFRSYFAAEGMEKHALLDPERELARALALPREPAVLLTDGDGNVLFVDTRLPGRASQFPIGRVLPGLAESLGAPQP